MTQLDVAVSLETMVDLVATQSLPVATAVQAAAS